MQIQCRYAMIVKYLLPGVLGKLPGVVGRPSTLPGGVFGS